MLLLPLFFAFTGLRTNVHLLMSPWLVLEALAIIAIAVVGKAASPLLASRLLALSRRDAIALGVLMNKGVTIRTAQQPGQRYMPRMLEHVQRGELDPSFLITHRMTLEESPQGYELFKTKQDGCLRAVFAP